MAFDVALRDNGSSGFDVALADAGGGAAPFMTGQTTAPAVAPRLRAAMAASVGTALVLLAGGASAALPPGAQATGRTPVAPSYAGVGYTLPTDDAIPAIRPVGDTRPPARLVAAGRSWTLDAIRDAAVVALPPGAAQAARGPQPAAVPRGTALGPPLEAVAAPFAPPALTAPARRASGPRTALDAGTLLLLRVAPPGAHQTEAPRRTARPVPSTPAANPLLTPGVDLPIGAAAAHRASAPARPQTIVGPSLLTSTLVPVVEPVPPGAGAIDQARRSRRLIPGPDGTSARVLLDAEPQPPGAAQAARPRLESLSRPAPTARASWLLDIAPVGAAALTRPDVARVTRPTGSQDGLRDVVVEPVPPGGSSSRAPARAAARVPSVPWRAALLLDVVVAADLPPGQAAAAAPRLTPVRPSSAAATLLVTTLAPVVEAVPPGAAAIATSARPTSASTRTWTGGPPDLAVPPGASATDRPTLRRPSLPGASAVGLVDDDLLPIGRTAATLPAPRPPVARPAIGRALIDDVPVPLGGAATASAPRVDRRRPGVTGGRPLEPPPPLPPGSGATLDGPRVPFIARPPQQFPSLPLPLAGPTIGLLTLSHESIAVPRVTAERLTLGTVDDDTVTAAQVTREALTRGRVTDETLTGPHVATESLEPS